MREVLVRIWLVIRWVLLSIFLIYTAIVIYEYPYVHQVHLDRAAAARIEAHHITEADVNGSKLPPPPDLDQVDATIAGIDDNANSIRDDAELAIFAEYPTSSPTSEAIRAAELQFAMDLQLELTDVVGQASWAAAEIQWSRGFGCLYDVSSGKYERLENEVLGLVLNTADRSHQDVAINRYGNSYKLASGPDCDVIRNAGHE